MASHKIIYSWLRLSPKHRRDFVLFAKGLYGRYKLAQEVLGIFIGLEEEELMDLSTDRLLRLIKQNSPSKHCTNKNLLNSLSDLTNWLHEYLVLDYMKMPKNAIDYDVLRLKALAQQKLSLEFNRIEKKVENRLDKVKHHNTDYYNQMMRLREIQLSVPWSEQLTNDFATPTDELMEYLESYYMNFKLKLGMEMINRNKLLNENHEIEGLPELRRKAQKNQSIIPRIHLLSLRIVEGWLYSDYEKLHEIYIKETDLPIQNQVDIMQILLNFCYKKMREPDKNKEFSKKSFGVFKLALDRGLLTYKGYMHKMFFQSAVILACKEKEYDWAEEFIANWKDYLTEEMKDSEQFALAKLYFAKGKYEDVQILLNDFQYRNIMIEFNCRTIQLQAQYELRWAEEVLVTKIDSFLRLIRRKGKINESYKNTNSQFAQCLRFLVTKKCGEVQMRAFLKEKRFSTQKDWLIEKSIENDKNQSNI